MTDCPICGRDKQNEFCLYHQTAFDNLKEMYTKWKIAASFSWEEYLDKLIEIESTGRWVKDVIEFIMQQDGF